MEDLDYKVVIVGEVSSGKSSFNNSLLGTYSCPTSILRKTVVKSEHSLISYNSSTNKDEVVHLIDYPGFNDATQNTFLKQFLEELKNYDHVIWITTAEKCLMNESEKKIFYSICDQVSLISKLIMVSVVVNKSDMNDSNDHVFRFEKNEYEILYDNMRTMLARDHPMVNIFKHSSYYTFLDKIEKTVFTLEPAYVDEFNRTIRAKHGPQSSTFKSNDMIDYSILLESSSLQQSNIKIPNTIEPYIFSAARTSRLENFKRALHSKHRTIGEDLELMYDSMIHGYSDHRYDILKKIKTRMTDMHLEAKIKNTNINLYLEQNDLDFRAVLKIVLNRQPNQVEFMNMLAAVMGEILYDLIDFDLLSQLNFRNSGKSEFLHFLLYMDSVTLISYNEEEYFTILDTIKVESKEAYFSKFEPQCSSITRKRVNRFIISGGELQLNVLIWNKILKLNGRFSIVKKLMDLVASNSFILTNEKRLNYLNISPTRLDMIQKKLTWNKYKSEISKLPRFMYKNLKFWYFNMQQIYLPSLYNPKLLTYPIEANCVKNDRDSVLPNFSDFYDKST